MKIGFYSPYLHVLGGGERYTLALASHWSKTHDVSIFCDDASVLRRAESGLGLDLSRVRAVENVFATRNIFKKMMVSRGYDILFFLTDGSIPTTFAKHNILHFQVPFQHVFLHPIKMRRFQAVVCNSDFTKRNIDARLGKRAVVIYPPVTPVRRTNGVKRKIILSVGRFHPLKKQDVLIEAFRKGVKGHLQDYSLVLAGGALPTSDEYLKRLQLAVKSLPVRLVPNASHKELAALYNQSSIYWHAAGYHETNPEHMEHFGISTVEAMSVGSVPIVYNGGGLPEIVRAGEEGFLWANTEDLIARTSQVIASTKLRQTLAKNSTSRSRVFSDQQFNTAFDKLLTKIIR